jgi:L,D-transpeptidase ErfK/SrfK
MRIATIVLVGFCAVAAAVNAQSLTGQVHTVTVARGDTLRALGSRFGVDPATIARDNGRALDALLSVGETLTIDSRHIVPPFDAGSSIIVNVPQRMLFVAAAAGVAGYPVAVGRADWPTPSGEFSIVSKEVNPIWHVPQSIREEARRAGRSLPVQVPPGPKNPLGAYWLGLSIGGVGIHGTNAPTSIYQVTTHGCIRLHAADIAALFRSVQIGTKGRLLYQPVLVGVDGDEVFVEAHRDVYRPGRDDALDFVRARTRELGVFERVDWDTAAEVIRQRAGVARSVAR